MKILDGKKLSAIYKESLRERIANLKTVPSLAIIQVGEIPESTLYVKRKKEFGESVGAKADIMNFSEDISEEDLISKIEKLNSDESVHGILVQLPLPKNLNKRNVLDSISVEKDVDGLTSESFKRLSNNEEGAMVPATTLGIYFLLKENEVEISGKEIALIGYSDLVGKPTEALMKNLGANVTVCDINTKDLIPFTKKADIIITAVGKPKLITKDHVKEGQVIVDIGTTIVDGKVYGDISFDEVSEVVEMITPVPGGVGPMTVVSLFENLIRVVE